MTAEDDKAKAGADQGNEALFGAVDEVLERMRERYLVWATADLAALRALVEQAGRLGAPERGPAAHDIFRRAHDIKGQGGSFNYPLMTRIGGALCRLLKERPELDDDALAVVLAHVEAMETVVVRRLEGDGGEVGTALLAGLG
jgi:chemotaxis protein histidine kinase CheA